MNDDKNVEQMTTVEDGFDRLLNECMGAKDELVPSSGFALAVMEAIDTEREIPAPIAFPWRRAAAGGTAVVAGLTFFVVLLTTGDRTGHMSDGVMSWSASHNISALGWAVAATAISLAALAGSLRIAGRAQGFLWRVR